VATGGSAVRAAIVARYSLGVIRLANGTIAFVAPGRLIKTFGKDPADNGAAVYALRLFGIRTIVLGLQLLVGRGEVLENALRYSVAIHASDAASAAVAGAAGHLPRKAAVTGVAISSVNTLLAIVATRGRRPHS
jgi:hypothetical protein